MLANYKNPCWIYNDADLAGIKTVAAEVTSLPYVFHDVSGTTAASESNSDTRWRVAGASGFLRRNGACDAAIATGGFESQCDVAAFIVAVYAAACIVFALSLRIPVPTSYG